MKGVDGVAVTHCHDIWVGLEDCGFESWPSPWQHLQDTLESRLHQKMQNNATTKKSLTLGSVVVIIFIEGQIS